MSLWYMYIIAPFALAIFMAVLIEVFGGKYLTRERIENNKHKQKRKTSKLVIASVVFGVIGFVIMPFVMRQHYFKPGHITQTLNHLFFTAWGLWVVLGMLLAIVGILHIRKSKKVLKGYKFAIAGIVLALFPSHIWVGNQFFSKSRSSAPYRPCGHNLNRIGRALLIYGLENGEYPTPSQWNDLLLQGGEVKLENFNCPSMVLYSPFFRDGFFWWPFPKKGMCHYAINPNCEPNSPPDTILLFETKDGWNQYGGKEILTKEKHGGGGCNILFNDSHAKFEAYKIEQLNWGGKQGNR